MIPGFFAQQMMVVGESIDPSYASVSSLLHFNGSTTFTDQKGLVWTPNGTAELDNTQAKFGTTSGIFDSSGYITTPLAALALGTGDFTIEQWTYESAHTRIQPCIFSNYNSFGSGSLSLFSGHNAADTGKFQMACNGTFPAIQSTIPIAYNVWRHIAIVRSSGTITLYIGGVADGTFNASGVTINGAGSSFTVGAALDNVTNTRFHGWIDDWRVTLTARYTSNFTPPAVQFPDS